jgi:hypothetical protein
MVGAQVLTKCCSNAPEQSGAREGGRGRSFSTISHIRSGSHKIQFLSASVIVKAVFKKGGIVGATVLAKCCSNAREQSGAREGGRGHSYLAISHIRTGLYRILF